MTKPQSLFSNWTEWGLPAVAGALAPWQEKITSANLISDYFEPTVSIVASFLAPIGCFVAYGILRRQARRRVEVSAAGALVACVSFVAVSLGFLYSLDSFWMPTGPLMFATWAVWIVSNLGIYCSFGMAMVSTAILLRGRTA